jgi:hypothetical protein
MKGSSDEVSNSSKPVVDGINNIQEASHDEDTTIFDQAVVEPSSLQQEKAKRAETYSEGEDQPSLCMQLSSLKTDDDECVIYLGDYETGDTVVLSALDCFRVFHHSKCSRPILAEGKRCPCHIDEQTAALVALVASCHSSEEIDDVEEMATKSQEQNQQGEASVTTSAPQEVNEEALAS